MNRPSHTTSTKCQDHATPSNAKWVSGLKWHIDEVPVPLYRFDREMDFRFEMAGETTGENHGQHERAEGHVESVEAGEHEERRAVDAGRELQVEVGISMDVFVGLEEKEGDSEGYREENEECELCALPFLQSPVGDRNRNT